MDQLPVYISTIFIVTTFVTLYFFYKASHSKLITGLLLLWISLQGFVAASGFYTIANTVPPRFILAILPPLLGIACAFFISGGKKFIDLCDMKDLTLLHSIRIPVELVLLGLFLFKAIPEIMTFEGRNLDILSGISAIFIWYFGFIKGQLHWKVLLAWNFICLVLLLNIVTIAVFSAPFPFQKFGLEQPNIAILHFPFIWLPCCVVPIVLFAHLAAIKQLIKNKRYRI